MRMTRSCTGESCEVKELQNKERWEVGVGESWRTPAGVQGVFVGGETAEGWNFSPQVGC